MPIYTDMGLAPASPLDIDDYSPTFGEYMKAAWGDTVNDNPGTVVSNMAQASEARYGFDLIAAAESGGLVSGLDEFRDIEPLPAMSMDDQKSYIKNEGLEGKLTPGEHYTKEELEFLVRLKHDEIDRRITREQAPAWMAPFGFAAGLAASMTDPINLATSFVPVVGEARVMSMLAKASGPWGRAGVRAAVGAVEGAVGAAIVEPMVAAGKSELQQEYDFADSLMNIVFGAGMGAAMHPLSGAIGDWKRARKGQRQPWEYVPSSNTTENLRMENARSIWKGMQESGSEKLSPEHAEAAAALWDATLRGYAYDTGEPVENLYRQYRTEYRGGKVEVLKNTEQEYSARLAEDVGTELDGIKAEEESAIQAEAVASQMDTAANVEGIAPIIEEVVDGHRRIRGLETSILNGQTSEPARYELRELADIIPSHDPEAQFAKRADYPEGVQERPYHSDSGEQEKVLRNAAVLDPRYLLNDNPDAVNGPPLVTESGIVLGGNSRTMSMQLAYGRFPERAEGYRNVLRQRAAMFGLDPAAVDTFERPVLVRVVPGGEDVADMAVRSRLYNQSQTQGLQAKAEGVSKARLLTVETMDTLATDMEDFDSLREFLASAKSKDFISALVRDGVIEQTQLSRLTDASGKLNDAGKDLVENALRGHIVPDYDVLNATPPTVLNKLDRAIPALARLKARGEGWDMSGVVTRALRVIASADAEGKDIGIYLGQGDLFQSGPKPAVQALALTFSNATQKEVQLRFTVLADAAEKQARGQTSLFAQTGNTPAREFVRAFMEPVASVDGEAVPSFNPTKNTEHAAIQYAYDHGGKGHSVSTAIEELQKKMSGRKTPTEEKARARELMGELGQFSGVVNIYEPKLGQFFSYRKGDELFQTAYHGTPHRFDEFSLEHIGEGEGAQAHGWGLYFAKNKRTGERYRKGLKKRGEQGQLFEVDIPENDVLLDEQKTFAEQHRNVKGLIVKAVEAFSPEEERRFYKKILGRKLDESRELVIARNELNDLASRQKSFLIAQAPKGVTFLTRKASLKFLGFSDEQIQRFIDNPEIGIEEAKKLIPAVTDAQSKVEVLAKQDGERKDAVIREAKEHPEKTLEKITGDDLYTAIAYALTDSKYEYREASLWLNKHGIKGITYDGQQDGRAFVVFDDKAIQVLNTFYQGQARGDQSPIVVRGDELGVSEGAEIKEYRKAAREVYRELQKTPAYREDLGEIRFSGDGFRKMQQAGADKRKWQLVPKLKELVENAEYIRRDELYKARRDGIIAFHWLETDVELNGEPLRVGFNIGEDAQGNKFYNLNHDLEEFRAKKEEALAGHLAHNRGPQTELPQGATAPVEARIPVSDDGVNLYILSESKTAEEPRARVTFGESDAYAVVEFFKAADPSSAPHEMYHIFRRIMSEMYEDPNASEASKERYRKACEFVGAEPGRAWTPEQEEKFARAGERFLLEGVTPTPQMGDVMESFQQWMAEIYGNAERSGLEISDGMREVFSGMMGTAEDGDMNFRYAMGKLLDYRPEAGIDTNIELPADTSPDQAIEEYMADSTARADEAFNALADKPQVQEFFKQEYEADMAEADTVIAEAQAMTEIRQAAAACVMRG